MDKEEPPRIKRERGVLEACFLGFEQSYPTTMTLMHSLHSQVANQMINDQLLLLEHQPVITITRQHMYKSIKTSEQSIKNSGLDLAIADRGGDATFHGPGQLVGYPIIFLNKTNPSLDISTYIRSLEHGLLMAIKSLGIDSATILPGFTGIWIKCVEKRKVMFKKLIAIGVGMKDGASKHGFALNIDIDYLRYAEHIIPCGLKDRGVITLRELFCYERLEMPTHSVIVKTVSESLAQIFSLTLKWRA